jgi:hypothetical protein
MTLQRMLEIPQLRRPVEARIKTQGDVLPDLARIVAKNIPLGISLSNEL